MSNAEMRNVANVIATRGTLPLISGYCSQSATSGKGEGPSRHFTRRSVTRVAISIATAVYNMMQYTPILLKILNMVSKANLKCTCKKH
ncbi:hypothetical protein FKM82_000191 [Ascaphus truei]